MYPFLSLCGLKHKVNFENSFQSRDHEQVAQRLDTILSVFPKQCYTVYFLEFELIAKVINQENLHKI